MVETVTDDDASRHQPEALLNSLQGKRADFTGADRVPTLGSRQQAYAFPPLPPDRYVAYSSHSELHTARRACMFV